MSIDFRPGVRANLPLLILLAGGTGSGKTESAFRIATGLAAGKRFAVIDTERGRALHKADDYAFDHANLEAPFTPERYIEALEAAGAAGYPVIVIDSGSHEYEGEGGILDIKEAEHQRLGGRESTNMVAWAAAKQRHKKYRNALLRSPAHLIVCHRAEDKIEIGKDAQGKTVVRPKQTLTGADGWVPICERRLPFEATISLLLTADAPGVPKPIKLESRHLALVPLDHPLDERVGEGLRAWAAGAGTPVNGAAAEAPSGAAAPTLATREEKMYLVQLAHERGVGEDDWRALLERVVGSPSTRSMTAEQRDVIRAELEGATA